MRLPFVKTILHIIDTTGPGGAETVFIDLATCLPKDRFRSLVLIRGKGWVYEELCRRGVEPILHDAKGSFNWRYLLKLRYLIKQEKVDLIQSHLLGSNVYASLASLLTRVPVIATFHGGVDIGEKERFKGLKFGAINLGSKRIVAVSESLRLDIIHRTSVRASKTDVIYNGIVTAEFQRPHENTLRQRFGWTDNKIIVGSLGNIRSAKGYDILLQAAARLKDKAAPFRFVIAGQGKHGLYDNLLKLRKDLGLEDVVHFLGFNDDPAGFLANLDVFLLSSISEGFSIATIQAMASKLPVVVTRSGGPEEIVTHGENGWLVKTGSPEAIVDALIILASESDLLDRMAEQGKKHAQNTFDINNMLSAYEDIYNDIL